MKPLLERALTQSRRCLRRLVGQLLLGVAGVLIVYHWEGFWQDRPFALAASISLVALILGPWLLAVATGLGFSLFAFFMLVNPYHTWGIASRSEIDATAVYAAFFLALNAAWYYLSRARRSASRDRDLLRHILEVHPAAVGTVSLSGKVLYANPKALELLGPQVVASERGPARGELIKREWLDGTPIPAGERPFDRAVATGQPVRLPRYRLSTPDQDPRIVETYAAPIRDRHGAIDSVMLLALDVTTQHEAEQLFRAQRRALEQIAASVPGVVYQYRPRSDTSPPCFPYASPRTADYFGCTPEQLAESTEAFWQWIPAAEHPAIRASIERATAAESSWAAEFRVQHPERGELWLKGNSTPARQPDGRVVWNGIFLDVTAHKRLELELQRAQKLEVVGRLTGGVAHDFNNILTAILGYADTIAFDSELSSAGSEDVEELKRAVHRAATLTRQLLSFSRQQPLAPEYVCVNQTAREMERLLTRLLGARIKLVCDLDELIDPVYADPGQLQQVLVNLVVNARDAIADSGRIDVRTRRVPAEDGESADDGSWVLLEVADSGTGMAPEVERRIFEPFFTTKAPGKGTGLGLATVGAIVTQLGGRITVETRLGAGTTFRVRLPASSGMLNGPDISRSGEFRALARRRSGTILLVEDDEPVRRVFRRVLEESGYQVLEARQGGDALALFDADPGRIDLLITDVILPGLTGPRLVELVRQRRAELPVLLVSGFADEAVQAQSRNDPRLRLLTKPFRRESVLKSIDDLTLASAAGSR